MQSLYDIPAPAKLNLFLHITGRRDDGYHLLQSAFMLIDWCDTLHFEVRSDGLVSREDLILSKLAWSKDSHSELQRRDVQQLLEQPVDRAYLLRWAPPLGVESALQALLP